MPATYEPIATTTLGSAAASITFSSIPATYTDLRLIIVYTLSAEAFAPQLTFNGDTTANYSRTALIGDGASATSTRTTGASSLNGYGTSGINPPTLVTYDVFSYAASTFKTALISNSQDLNGSGQVGAFVGLWRNTSAITSLRLAVSGGNTFATGTTATLYGIKNA